MEADTFAQFRLQQLITEREAMIVANKEREMQGYAPAYGPKQFYALANTFHTVAQNLS